MTPHSPETTETTETLLCTACLAENREDATFCADCGAPVGPHAGIGPFESAMAEGFLCRRAVENPRSGLVVLGVMGMVIPMGFVGVLIAVSSVGGSVLELVGGSALALLSAAILAKTAWGYFRRLA